MMKPARQALAWIAVASAAAGSGCSTGGALREEAQKESWYRDEREYISAQGTSLLRGAIPLDADPALWKQVQPIMTRLHEAVKEEARGELENRFHLRILKTEMVNALTLPNGRIYVTTGLLQLVDHESALAGVLAHEMAHYLLSHTSRRLDRNLVSMVVNSPDDELEADREGLRIARKAGFARDGLLRFLKRVQSLERRSGMRFGGFLTSHPDIGRRIAIQQELLNKDSASTAVPAAADFRALKQALFERQEKYSPGLRTWDVENSKLGADWNATRERVRWGVELDRAHPQLMTWVAQAGLDAESRQAVTLALIQLELDDGRWSEADAWLKRIESEKRADLGSWVLRFEWLLGEEGQAALWERIENIALDAECAASQDCLSAALIWAGRTRMDPRRLDGLRSKLGPASLRHPAAANWEEVLAIRLALRDPDERPSPKALTQEGFRAPSRLLLDWRELDRDLRERGQKIRTHEWGSLFSVLASAGGLSAGSAASLLGTGTAWGIAFGSENWPYAGGTSFSWSSGDARLSPSYTTRDWSLWGRRDFAEGRWRPWIGGSLGYEWVDDRAIKGRSIGGGLAARAQAGLDFRLPREKAASELWLTARAGLRGAAWTSTTGFEASGVGWEVWAGISLRTDRHGINPFGFEPAPDPETGELAFQAPPVFY